MSFIYNIMSALKKGIRKIVKNSPIYLNRAGLNQKSRSLFTGFEDPRKIISGSVLSRQEFSKAVSTFQSGSTWKTTHPTRHPLSDNIILGLVSANVTVSILDAGVSDGSTSLNLIEKLQNNFETYYITDLHFYVNVRTNDDNTYFYNPGTKECFAIANRKFIIHANVRSNFFLLNWMAKYYFSKVPPFNGEACESITLYQPDLDSLSKSDSRIKILEWDIFCPWERDTVDLIKIANVLNPIYFSNDKICLALEHLFGALKSGGYLVVVENREYEQWSVFRKIDNKLFLENSGNGGSDITGLIENAIFPDKTTTE